MSVVSVTAFLIDFPEFQKVDRLLIERKLNSAEEDTPLSIWSTRQREGIMLQAAHLISLTPLGQAARLVTPLSQATNLEVDDPETTYEKDRMNLERTVSLGLGRVI